MNNAIAIKFDYNNDRKDPEEILNILTGYVRFYKSIGVISLSSINEKESAHFDLVGLKTGSAIAIIRCISEKFNDLIFNAASELADDLHEKPEVSERKDLDEIASNLSESIAKDENHPLKIEPHIDIEHLGKVLFDYSILNSKLHAGERSFISKGPMNDDVFSDYKELSTKFTFVGSVEDVLSLDIKHHRRVSKFYVNVTVNKGATVWKLEELDTKNTFSAKIMDNDWLQEYQSGLIGPIGPKDVMVALVEYDEALATVNSRTKKKNFKNAKILEVVKIINVGGQQGDIFEEKRE